MIGIGTGAAVLFGSQLAAKAICALRYARNAPTVSRLDGSSLTLLQAILSGDPSLSATLEANLRELPPTTFFWLVDDDDRQGRKICEDLVVRYPNHDVRLISCSPPPQGVNPKVHKLQLALQHVQTNFIAVVDDDTRVTVRGLAALIDGLEAGAVLTTGLPCYIPAQGMPSRALAEFVNSSAILTYLPMVAFCEPLTINGMCYAIRTEDVRRLDAFRTIARSLTDDLGIAELIRQTGGRIYQTIYPQFITTTVSSGLSLCRLLHRWFVFTRLLLESQPLYRRLLILTTYGLPPALLWVMILCVHSIPAALVATGLLAFRAAIIVGLQRRFCGRWQYYPFASLVMELVQPIFLVASYAKRTIRWRSRRIRVWSISRFEYL
jgi:ceramide glucosyltransferase